MLAQHDISIHALRKEGDGHSYRRLLQRTSNFYPRPPQGGRHSTWDAAGIVLVISIHALRKEGDVWMSWTSASAP